MFVVRNRCLHVGRCFSPRLFSCLKTTRSRGINTQETKFDEKQDVPEEEHLKEPLYEGHIPTNTVQKLALAVGSSFVSLINPYRGDMVAVCGETTGELALRQMYKKMTRSQEGRQVLTDRPIINTKTVDFEKLKTLPVSSFGHSYVSFMESLKITPDTRSTVKFVDDEQLAYVMRRYREIHDFVHCLCDMDISILGEVTVKWIEALQNNLPMTWAAGIFGSVQLTASERRQYRQTHLPWALKCGHEAQFFMNIYFEKRWEQNIDDLRRELKIPPLITRRRMQ